MKYDIVMEYKRYICAGYPSGGEHSFGATDWLDVSKDWDCYWSCDSEYYCDHYRKSLHNNVLNPRCAFLEEQRYKIMKSTYKFEYDEEEGKVVIGKKSYRMIDIIRLEVNRETLIGDEKEEKKDEMDYKAIDMITRVCANNADCSDCVFWDCNSLEIPCKLRNKIPEDWKKIKAGDGDV